MNEVTPATQLDLYESLCDSLQDSVFLLDGDGTLFHANSRFVAATGIPEGRLVGRHYTDLDEFVRDDAFDAFKDHVEAVLGGEAAERRVELAVRSPLEGDVVVEARITAFNHAEVSGAAVVLRDQTEMVEQAEALRTKSEQLAVVNRVLRHDIRNHMNVLLGWGEQLERRLETAEAEEIRDRMQRHGYHVVELTYAARDLEEAVEEAWELDLRPVDLGPVLEREVEFVREQFPDATISTPQEFPSTAVLADDFLGSVVSNLLTNAVRHNDADEPTATVTVEKGPETVEVAVADDGPGIPDAQKEVVYERGEKGPDSPGSGLGLYLVQSLVDAYGGTVTIADNDPRGTVVSVELRRAG
jgi:PAS domain S-box-containing protein